MWHKSSGIIRYDPPRPGMKKKTDWWAIVTVDREITRYYRWWVERRFHVKLAQPSWDAHVSIIRGERPPKNLQHLWKKYDGQHIDFNYNGMIRQSGDTTKRPGDYWFVEIDCPQLTAIRDEFGFPSDWKLHLTVGRTWYDVGQVCPPPPR